MPSASSEPRSPLRRSLESGRVHSGYLISGPGTAPREAALEFVRGLVCAQIPGPCEDCVDCRRSSPREEIQIDGTGKKGPLLRHVGDHADLFWINRGDGDTRVRIAQIRALQNALRLRTSEGGRRAAVIADAEWMNQEAQNALLRLLEEPPPETTLVLVTATSAGLLATVRSRCQRIQIRPSATDTLDDPERDALRARIDAITSMGVPELLDWAAEYRGARSTVVGGVQKFLEIASQQLRESVTASVRKPGVDVSRQLDAFQILGDCRKTLSQRNANPQMVVERALLTLRESAQR